ncbi:MAG: sigma-70 family RNA polymerase sigma factor [Oscillospiraceae bacterium]|jgi:RNA polymerase sigma-70 factor (ECF subfamily)|nr:sigma-70 family RNA polymerase sigma factor [Oscillospiraceae bacterium]
MSLSLNSAEDFPGVFERYSQMVYRLVLARVRNPADADDITQDLFLKYVSHKKIYNDEEHRKAWLIRAAVNTSKTFVTSAWNRHRSADELPDTLGAGNPDIENAEAKSTVLDAVMSLPVKYRTAIHLFYYEDMQTNQIAAVLGVPENTVKSHLRRARSLLQTKLKGVDFDEV